MLTWRRIASATAVWAALAGLTGMAQAHPGHDHGPRHHIGNSHAGHYRAAPSDRTASPQANLSAEKRSTRPLHQELSAAAADRPADAGADTCSDRGCCAPGSCNACVSLVAPDLPTTFPPSLSGSIAARDGPTRSGLGASSLQRPPNTFA